jgi:hypothetical protein
MSLPIKIKHTLRAVFRLVKIFIVLPANAQSKYEKKVTWYNAHIIYLSQCKQNTVLCINNLILMHK